MADILNRFPPSSTTTLVVNLLAWLLVVACLVGSIYVLSLLPLPVLILGALLPVLPLRRIWRSSATNLR